MSKYMVTAKVLKADNSLGYPIGYEWNCSFNTVSEAWEFMKLICQTHITDVLNGSITVKAK